MRGLAASCINHCVCVCVKRGCGMKYVEHLCRKVVASAHFGRRIEHIVQWIRFSNLCATVGVQYVTFIQNMEAKQNLSISVVCVQCGCKTRSLVL